MYYLQVWTFYHLNSVYEAANKFSILMFHITDMICIKVFHSCFIEKASLSIFDRLLKFL